MCAKPVVIAHVRCEQSLEMPFVQHDNVIQTFAAETANEPFPVRILPGTPWCDLRFLNAHVPQPLPKDGFVDAVAIPEQVPWGLIQWERFDDLLRRPLRGGVRGDVDVDDPT